MKDIYLYLILVAMKAEEVCRNTILTLEDLFQTTYVYLFKYLDTEIEMFSISLFSFISLGLYF